jgi:uncharacterized membrane protein
VRGSANPLRTEEAKTLGHGQRVVAIDVARGLAIAGVVLFHIVWDLEYTGMINGVARHPVWLAFGRSLAGTFMFLVGVSLVLAHPATIDVRAFGRRLLTIIAFAGVISVVTWFIFPDSFIYFGILHAIAAATLCGAVFLRTSATVCLGLAVAVVVLPFIVHTPAFDTRWLAWTGFAENPPPSNDFVPIFPWVGITLVGMATAKLLPFRSSRNSAAKLRKHSWFAGVLVWMGNRSLSIYLLHQPILLSLIIPLSWVLSTQR